MKKFKLGPFDSVISDNEGKFEIHYVAEGTSVDYGLSLSYNYDQQTNYMMDAGGIFRFNYYKTVMNADVRARELNYTKLHLKVDYNPYDSFYVRTETTWFETLIKGQRIDTTIYLRHLPISHTIIQYYTQSYRDTIGLAALNAGAGPNDHHYSITRILTDTIVADWADTLVVSKIITSTLSMPRQ